MPIYHLFLKALKKIIDRKIDNFEFSLSEHKADLYLKAAGFSLDADGYYSQDAYRRIHFITDCEEMTLFFLI